MRKDLCALLVKGRVFVFAMAVAVAWTGGAETVTNVRGAQREKSDLVDIYYDLVAEEGGSYTVEVQVEGRTNEVNASTFMGDVGEGIAPGRNRHILWNAGANWPGRKGDVKAVITVTKRDGKRGKVQLWAGGPFWADRNIGAAKPEDYGLYFWWGDTTGHRPSGTTFGFNFHYDNPAIYTYQKSIDTLLSEGWIVSKNGTYVLAPAHDAAHVRWGGGWRMPTYQELYDLCYTYCDWARTTMHGVNGYVVRGRGAYASNSIFLPAAGYGNATEPGHDNGVTFVCAGSEGDYWSSVPDHSRFDSAFLIFYEGIISTGYLYGCRYFGLPVRPVHGFTE